MDIDALQLPAGTHATILTGRDVLTGEQLAYPIVWADRIYDECPRCGQPVARVVEDCPVLLDTGAGAGGTVLPLDQKHDCGFWLSVDWTELPEDATEADVLAAAATLSEGLAQEINEARQTILAGLRRDLAEALTLLARPLEEGETAEDREHQVRTGSEMEPGVYREGEQWIAWDNDPDGSGDPLTVSSADLAGTTE